MTMKIILSGGGTLGSVSPLIAIYQTLVTRGDCEFLWVGTQGGPEMKLVSEYGIRYIAIPSGKYRRYFSLQNFLDPFIITFSFFSSLLIIIKYKPNIIISAGGFVSVPLVWAGWFLRKPILIHQQDARPGLANKLMARVARKITVTFERAYKYFGREKSVIIGNPVRKDLYFEDKDTSFKFFGFSKDLPVILVLGGGTGARSINKLVFDSLENLVTFTQVIHSTGSGKSSTKAEHSRYKSFEYLDTATLRYAYSAADIVISRAGMSTLTELAYLGKATILIPMPSSHQEDNAFEFGRFNACEILNQQELDGASFAKIIKDILFDTPLVHELSRNITKVMPQDANERIVQEIMKIIKV